ncbi:hypothetical protein [Fluviispira vulneris]|uniref:hypothetical protein n=1 Tax=Fluviispira vulneris TaxID=2763012 RepID=UPI0016489739|nr:hypothetical protein [Fluviispira vulneris]
MKYLLLKSIFLGIAPGIIQNNAHANSIAWSWLYCVSNSSIAVSATDNYCTGLSCIKTNWQYAHKENIETLIPYIENKSLGVSNGVYIYSKGFKTFNNLEFAIVNQEFDNEEDARIFCSTIEEKCRNDNLNFGKNYSAVGYGDTFSIWRGIRAEFPGGGVNCKSNFPRRYIK